MIDSDNQSELEADFTTTPDRVFAGYVQKFANNLDDTPDFRFIRAMLTIAAERIQRASRGSLSADDRKRAQEQLRGTMTRK